MILIVDDKQENLFSLQKLLEIHKFNVDTANSGEEALKKILKNYYSLIILDVQMPEMDGFEVAQAISGYGKSKDIPIIFLSAVKINKTFITRGYESGGIDYVTKPFDPDVLLLKIKTFFRLSEQKRVLNEMQINLREEIEFRKKAERDLSALNHSLEQRVKERTEELYRINAQLLMSNHDLQQYASVASHDLKEPLRKIQIYADRVRMSFLSDNPDGQVLMEKIIGSTQRMSRLINDLLNYSQLSGESMFQRCNVNKMMEEIIADLELLIKDKHALIRTEPFPEMEVIPGQMRQLLQNVLSNSLKFSKPGTPPVIHIKVGTVSQKRIDAAADPAGDYCRFSIRDNGIGFNDAYKERIFAMFQRLHPRTAFEGTGIGLAIVKKIVEKHNGLVDVESTEGNGTTFIFILPLKQQQAVAALHSK